MPFALHFERLELDRAKDLQRPILFFDGACVLCNKTVQWLLRNERHDNLQFAALNSQTAEKHLNGTRYAEHTNSILLLEPNGNLFEASNAAFRTVRHLKTPWKALYILMAIPRFLREPVYRLVAKNRKRLFGSTDHCALLSDVDPDRLLQ